MTSDMKDQSQNSDSACNLEFVCLAHASGLFEQLGKTIKVLNRRDRSSKRAVSELNLLLLKNQFHSSKPCFPKFKLADIKIHSRYLF